MNTLAFILPPKSSAPHAEDSHFSSSPSEKSGETFDSIIKRALSQPKRERASDSNNSVSEKSPAPKQRADAHPSHLAKSESAPAKKLTVNNDDQTQSAPERDSANPLNSDSSSQTVDSESADSDNNDANPSQSKPDEKESTKTEVTTPLMVALPISEPAIIPPKTEPTPTSANGNAATAITAASSGEQPEVTNASAASPSVQPSEDKDVSGEVAKLNPTQPDSTRKKSSVSAEHPAKKSEQQDGAVAVNKLLTKVEAIEEKPVNSTALGDSKAQPTPHELSGISTAQQSATMKNADTAEKISGQVEQTLPTDPAVKSAPRAASADRPAAVTAAKAVDSLTSTHSTNIERPAAPPTADNMISASGQTELRLRALDRTHDIVALHAMRMQDSNTESLHVVIKPGAGVQLSLDLKQTASGIEAQAILNRGDFQQLNQHWNELQQRLEERGIKLAPLTGSENSTASSGDNFSKQNQHTHGEPLASGAFAEFALAGAVADKAAQRTARVTSHRGWEGWA